MRHIHFVLIGAVVGLLSAANAHANAIYQWHSTSPGSLVTATGGELVFTNAAYRSGSIDFYVNDWYYGQGTSPWVQYGDFGIINSPVILASINVTAMDGQSLGPYVEPGRLAFLENDYSFASMLTFNDDGTLTGDLFIQGESDEASSSGDHYDWIVDGFSSDYFGEGECSGSMYCDAGSGYWQLSSVTPVPEPPVWPVFGIGVLGVLGLVSLRRTAKPT